MTHILIVDDKEENLSYLSALLTGHGHAITRARHGAEALLLARQNPPGLIISDLLMPVMDGYTLLRYWKSEPRLRHIPFLVYTATYTGSEDEKLARDLGADDFVLKPCEPEEFVLRVKQVLAAAAALPPAFPAGEDGAVLKVYSETLIRKLEEKTLQLEEANRALQRDIAERQRAEESLRESEERFRQLAENIDEVFWITDPDKNHMLYVSPAYERIWGRPCAELYSAPHRWMDAIHPDDRERVTAAAYRQATGQYDITYRIRCADGSIRWIRDRAFPVANAQGRVYRVVGTAEDITERRRLEEQFLRSQRLESIGALAGGIAHDMNNLLAPITMGAELLRSHVTDAGARRVLDNMARSAQRGASLVKQVLSFARGVDGARVAVHLGDIVREVEAIVANTFPKNISFESNLPSDLPLVSGDPTQLNQVLLNLCVNARDAMPEGGRLSLTSRVAEIDGQYAAMRAPLIEGRYVVLQVTDTGSGMTRDVLDHMFEPFFTTKGPGYGSGLGLSTVLGIVRSHGGHIEVDSEPGRGTTFQVFLPVRIAADHETAPVPTAGAAPGGQGEMLLVVDDDAQVLSVTRQTLEAHGYTVLTAGDGAQAMAKFALNRSRLSGVFTDLMMPVMDGIALISALRRIDPQLRILAATGLQDVEHTPRLAQLGVPDILSKPYTATQLLQAVRKLLDN